MFMSAVRPVFVTLVVRGELAGVVDALGVVGCGLFVPALGVGDVLAPGELLLGTVCDGVVMPPAVPVELLLVCPLAHPHTANAAMDAMEMTTDFIEPMGVFSE